MMVFSGVVDKKMVNFMNATFTLFGKHYLKSPLRTSSTCLVCWAGNEREDKSFVFQEITVLNGIL